MSLERMLNARSVAVIGASLDEKKRGYQAIKVLLDQKYDGVIYPINPREESILGLRCYRSVLDVEGEVDLALITTPAQTIPDIMEECGRKGLAGVVIVAGGFRELGEKGRHLQEKIAAIALKHGVRIIGPNTSGVINTKKNLNLVGLTHVPRGDLALISQSGNMALHIITEAALKSRKGFAYYVGVGNEADVKFHEYLELFKNDPDVRAIVMYVEGMNDGRRFLQEAYRATTVKPVVLLKSGRSSKGHRSAGSHTGALAGISAVSRTAFVRAGIINIDSSDELFPIAEVVSSLPAIKNNRVAILADGGGHATLAADVLTELGVEIPELRKETRRRLKEVLNPNASLHNPVDIAGAADADPSVFASCTRILLEDDHVGGLLVAGLFGGYGIRFAEELKFIEEDAAHQMGKLVKKLEKPIVVQSLYNFARPHSHELLRYYNIPVMDSLDIACKGMAALCQYGHWLGTSHNRTNFVFHWGNKATGEGRDIMEKALDQGRRALLEPEARQILKLHGAPVAPGGLAASAEEAVKLAAGMGGPVALKLVSPDILHKSDAGGVCLNLEGDREIARAFGEIQRKAKRHSPGADIRGCLVSPMADPGLEIIIGTKIDEQFGPVIMFGLGGILVEVLQDVVFRVLPVSRWSARQMITELKAHHILNGIRGKPPVDKNAICDLIMTVSEIIEAYPQIREIDLNPVIACEKSLTVVDARIILKKNSNNHR
jgi:acyl-CoA synthetase (NDP forming)